MNNITAGTIARTVCLLLALINQVLAMSGHSIIPIEDETINQLVTLIWTIAASAVAWWKNNSFSVAAREADQIMHERKTIAKDGKV